MTTKRAGLAMAAVGLMNAEVGTSQRDSLPKAEVRPLEGTWRVQITLQNCQTAQPLRPPFPAMATFARGGTLTTSDGGLSPTARGAGHGNWLHTARQRFEAVTEAFLFDPSGAVNGTQRIRQVIDVVSSDEFRATVSATILDAQGRVRGTGCATSIGRRME